MADLKDPLTRYKIGLMLIPGIGGILARKLIEYTGSPEGVFKSDVEQLQKIPGIGRTLAENILKKNVLEEADREIGFLTRYNVDALCYLDDEYPSRLKECQDAPVVLFNRGCAGLGNPKVLSIVGTRNASGYGLDFCRNLVEELAARGHNPLIVSGLAYGIDICAHRAALENGLQTVAVLAHGLSTIYPSEHRKTAREIVKHGSLVTDFGSRTGPDRGNFLKRNRIIAGLADATVVIESSLSGGALITAGLAGTYNRDVFALPGRVTDKRSQGCNNLIKTNKAALIEKVEDLEYIMGWSPCMTGNVKHGVFHNNDLNDVEKAVIQLLSADKPMPADRISALLELTASQTSCLLLELEFKGCIVSLPGKAYRLAAGHMKP